MTLMKLFKLNSDVTYTDLKEVAIALVEYGPHLVLVNGERLQSEYEGKTFNASPQTSGTYTQQLAHAMQIVEGHFNRNVKQTS